MEGGIAWEAEKRVASFPGRKKGLQDFQRLKLPDQRLGPTPTLLKPAGEGD